jgi:hypothetical protein
MLWWIACSTVCDISLNAGMHEVEQLRVAAQLADFQFQGLLDRRSRVGQSVAESIHNFNHDLGDGRILGAALVRHELTVDGLFSRDSVTHPISSGEDGVGDVPD